VTCGATTGASAPLDLRYFFTREIRLQGSIMGTLQELETVTAHVAAGRLRPVIAAVYPLAEAVQAHQKLAGGDFFGKMVLKIE
jgi:NADPH:quinone reductase-like Zn-dependent oxidoreductase